MTKIHYFKSKNYNLDINSASFIIRLNFGEN